jgi:hypothetical protein
MDRARRAMPIGNKQCYAKTVKANQDKHRMNLATVKCSVDNTPPQRFAHLQKNQKKEQLMVSIQRLSCLHRWIFCAIQLHQGGGGAYGPNRAPPY